MLNRMQTAYLKKKDDCINTIDNGGQCDYDKPEQFALRAAYPLAWLRFTAATTLFDDNAEQSKKLLNEAIEGFTNSMLAMPDPNLIRENTLGRAYCERELGHCRLEVFVNIPTVQRGGVNNRPHIVNVFSVHVCARRNQDANHIVVSVISGAT